MAWKRRGGRKVIIAPDSSDAWAPAKPRPDETLIRALARAHRWKRMLDEGRYRSAGEIAEAENVTKSFVNRLIRLTLLAPEIQEAILDGRQPKGMQLEELTRVMPSEWGSNGRHLSLVRKHDYTAIAESDPTICLTRKSATSAREMKPHRHRLGSTMT
jgi:hypothetical protein